MKDLMERLIADIAKHGAESDLMFSSSKSLMMSAQNASLSQYKVTSAQILGVRVIKDGRVGISYTEALDEISLKNLVKEALGNAEISEPNVHEKILPESGHLSDEKMYTDPEVSIETKIAKALELETKVKEKDARVKAVPYNSYSENEYYSSYMNSRGRSTSYKDKIYSVTSSALMSENKKNASYYESHYAHSFNDLDWDKVTQNSLFHAGNLLQEESLVTGRYQIKFSEDCLQELMGCFANFYSAKSAMDKINPWSMKLGEQVISKDLSIQDCPLYEDAFRITRFDSEGVERHDLALIQNGVLKSFMHNSVTANYFGVKTTGHGSRGASSSIGVAGTHQLITGQNVKPMPSKYLEIIQMSGLYSGANRVTGDFSVAIKGYVWENGQRSTTFGNITLSANFMDIFNRVEIVGKDLVASTDRSFFSVPLVFFDISVAGS